MRGRGIKTAVVWLVASAFLASLLPVARAAAPQLSVSIEVDKAQARRGDVLRYEMLVTNLGDADALNTEVTSHIPEQTTGAPHECPPEEECIVVDVPTPGLGESVHQVRHTRIGTLPPGESIVLVLRVRIDDDAIIGSRIPNHLHASATNHPEATSGTVETLVVGEDCAAPGVHTLTATADSWIKEEDPDKNLGTDSNLFVRSKASGDDFSPQNNRTLVRFDLPAAADCRVAKATLRLFAKSVFGTRTVLAHRTASAWSETGVTWANQPGTVGEPASLERGMTGWWEWDVTGHVQAQYAGANDGFILRDTVEDEDAYQNFTSREDEPTDPELEITFE